MQVYSNKEIQKQKDDLIKDLADLNQWAQTFVTSIELTAVECLSDKQKSKITELWEDIYN